jgi:hypothetical protein
MRDGRRYAILLEVQRTSAAFMAATTASGIRMAFDIRVYGNLSCLRSLRPSTADGGAIALENGCAPEQPLKRSENANGYETARHDANPPFHHFNLKGVRGSVFAEAPEDRCK